VSRATDELLVSLEPVSAVPEIGLVNDLLTLTKARLSLLVVMTTFVGFCAASGPHLDWVLLVHTIGGTTLAAAAAAALNQWMESHVDRLMERTRHRPLPAARMKPHQALSFGVLLGTTGVGWLAFTAGMVSAALAAATILIYLLLYTPLKRRTAWCTIIGAISGAIPPVIGWTAAQPSHNGFGLGAGAWILFGILFTWQMPHFLAIAWMYRDEYAQAGFVMLKRADRSGSTTALISFVFTLALCVVALIPSMIGMASPVYGAVAAVLNLGMLWCAGRFVVDRSRNTARTLFFASILFLPLLLGTLVFTKL
jgi:protoheme IX farnesyltransferase